MVVSFVFEAAVHNMLQSVLLPLGCFVIGFSLVNFVRAHKDPLLKYQGLLVIVIQLSHAVGETLNYLLLLLPMGDWVKHKNLHFKGQPIVFADEFPVVYNQHVKLFPLIVLDLICNQSHSILGLEFTFEIIQFIVLVNPFFLGKFVL